MGEPTALVVRPRRLQVVATAFSVALTILSLIGWFALPTETRVLFSLSQRITLVGVVGLLLAVLVALATSVVRADADGLVIRNGLRTHEVPWDRVHQIVLRRGDPWALLLVSPPGEQAPGSDPDPGRRQLIGLQAGDDASLQRLRQLHERYRGRS